MNSNYWGTTKPPAGVALDMSHPLSLGLVARWAFRNGSGYLINDVTDAKVALPANITWARGENSYSVSSSSTGVVALGTSVPVSLSNNFTWVLDVVFTSVSALYVPVIHVSAGYFLSTNSGPVTLGRTGVAHDVSGPTLVAYKRYRIAVTVGDGSSPAVKIYLNGALSASGTTTKTTPSGGLTLGSGAYGFPGSISDFAIYNRALTASEVASLSAAPYQMFAPPVWRRYFVPAGAAGDTQQPYSWVPNLGPMLAQ